MGGRGAFVGEGEPRFAAFGVFKEVAVGVCFDAEGEDEVANRNRAGAVFLEEAMVFLLCDDFHGFETDDSVDLLLDAVVPAVPVRGLEVG